MRKINSLIYGDMVLIPAFLIFSICLFLSGRIDLLLVVLNSAVLFIFFKTARTFLVAIYTLASFVFFQLPVLIGAFWNIYHPIHGFVNDFSLQQIFSQHEALLYVLFYNILLFTGYVFFKTIFSERPFGILKYRMKMPDSKLLLNFLLIAIFTISIFAKIYLHRHGVYVMLEKAQITPFLQFFKALSQFNILFLLICGYYVNKRIFRSLIFYAIYLAGIGLSLYLALLSGSRFQILLVLAILIYNHRKFLLSHKVIAISFAIFLVIFMTLAFPALAQYRNYPGTSLVEAFEYSVYNMDDFKMRLLNIAVTRFNYIDILSRIIRTHSDGPGYRFDYIQNIIGLVPRAIWYSKPKIGIDLNRIGWELGFIGSHDRNTSVGLSVVGESYYELGYFGLLVSIFHAFLFYIIDIKFRYENVTCHALYGMLALFIISKDSFIAVVPGLIYTIFPAILFTYLFNARVEENT